MVTFVIQTNRNTVANLPIVSKSAFGHTGDIIASSVEQKITIFTLTTFIMIRRCAAMAHRMISFLFVTRVILLRIRIVIIGKSISRHWSIPCTQMENASLQKTKCKPLSPHTHNRIYMAEKRECPDCHSKNTYVLVGGLVVCRDCGYDQRNITKKQETKAWQ